MQKILSMALMIAIGFVLCRKKLLTDSSAFSTLCLYVVMPCVMINSFQMEMSKDKLMGLLVTLIASVIAHGVFLLFVWVSGKKFPMKPVEAASLIYSNAGNLIIPLVVSVLGQEYVLYCCSFLVVQLLLFWTHGVILMGGKENIQWKKILTNPNMLSVYIAVTLYFTQIKLPGIVAATVDGVAALVGPLSMIIVGVIMGNSDLKKVFSNHRAYVICGVRLLVLPLICILLFKAAGLTGWFEGAKQVVLVTTLATAAPAASSVTQLAQVHNRDYVRASVINIMSVVFCIVTMPVMVYVYQLICF